MPNKSFQERADAKARLKSAITAMRAILQLSILPAHKRELLSVCLWKVTEASGSKYQTRFRSKKSLKTLRKEWQHEHVYQRRFLVDRLMKNPRSLQSVVTTAVGCVVTKEEHIRLSAASRKNSKLDGWARYRAARVPVIDTVSGRPLLRSIRKPKPRG